MSKPIISVSDGKSEVKAASFLLSVLKWNPLYGSDGKGFKEKVEYYIHELKDMEASLDIDDKSSFFEGREDEVNSILNTFTRSDSSKEIGELNL